MQYIIWDGDEFACHILAMNPFDAALQYCDHYIFVDDGTFEFEVTGIECGNCWEVIVKISLEHGITDGLESLQVIRSYSVELKLVEFEDDEGDQ